MASKTIKTGTREIKVAASDTMVALDVAEVKPRTWICTDLTPEQAYKLVDFITENVKRPEPPKFVPRDGVYTASWDGSGARTAIYKYRDNAWRNADGYVLEGEQERLTEDAKKGRLVRLVRETDNA